MTEPVNMKTLGGLSYNENLVSSAKKLKNGKFEIIFKSGEKITYPYQKDFVRIDGSQGKAKTGEDINNGEGHRNAAIHQTIDSGLVYDDTYFDIKNVMGATFTSSEDTVSHVNLINSSNTTIDLSANDSKWYGDDAYVKGGANNKVILDKNDTANIEGYSIDGQGVAAQKDYKKPE